MSDDFLNAVAARAVEDSAQYAVPRLMEFAEKHGLTVAQFLELTHVVAHIMREHGDNIGRMAKDLIVDTIRNSSR